MVRLTQFFPSLCRRVEERITRHRLTFLPPQTVTLLTSQEKKNLAVRLPLFSHLSFDIINARQSNYSPFSVAICSVSILPPGREEGISTGTENPGVSECCRGFSPPFPSPLVLVSPSFCFIRNSLRTQQRPRWI